MGDGLLEFLSSFGEWRSVDEGESIAEAASCEWKDKCTALCECMQGVEVSSFQEAARATEGLAADLAGIHERMAVAEVSSSPPRHILWLLSLSLSSSLSPPPLHHQPFPLSPPPLPPLFPLTLSRGAIIVPATVIFAWDPLRPSLRHPQRGHSSDFHHAPECSTRKLSQRRSSCSAGSCQRFTVNF